MRKLILIAGFVLASATAQAGEVRSLSRLDSDPPAALAPTRAVESSQTAQARKPPRLRKRPRNMSSGPHWLNRTTI
jgi:hypothetical protein